MKLFKKKKKPVLLYTSSNAVKFDTTSLKILMAIFLYPPS